MEKVVSIGMGVYNVSKFIESTLISIIKQTYKNWELIVIDDGSTDDTLVKINAFNDQRIKVFSDGKNKGLPTRLNECIELSTGYYFARMDGDDVMAVDRLEKQVKYLENNPSVDLVGTLAVIIDEENQVFATKQKYVPQTVQDIVRSGTYFVHPTVMGRLAWFDYHKYDSSGHRGEDFELWIRTFEASKFYIMDEYLLFYREFRANSRTKYYLAYAFMERVLTKHRDKISLSLYYKTIWNAYFKYLFFGLFNYWGLLQRRKPLKINELNKYQRQLESIIQNK